MLDFALVRAVEIVGEAASRMTPEGRAELSDVHWSSIVGMRNRLVYAFFGIDLDIRWNTAIEALPRLCDQIRPALAAFPDDRRTGPGSAPADS